MRVSGCNIFIYFLPLGIPRMGTLFVYIQLFVLDQYTNKNRENIFILMSFVLLFIFIICYQSSNLRALVTTFIIAEIVDLSQDFSSPYHVSSQQHMICSLSTQQERQIFGDQSKAMIDTNKSSYGRQYTSKVCSRCGKIGHVIDTCFKKHGFPP